MTTNGAARIRHFSDPHLRHARCGVAEDARRANDQALVELFTKAQSESRKGAEQAKQLLAGRMS